MTLQLIVQCIIIYSVRLCDIAGVPTKTVDLIFFRLCGVGSFIMINLEKEIREQPGVLSGLEKVNGETVRALVADAKSKGVKNICFAARGTSDHASIYAQYIFGVYAGLPCSLATPSVISKYGAKVEYKDTLVIGVSQSGQAADVRAVIRDAKECGCITAAVTNNEDSPLAKEADYHLFCAAGPEVSIAATKTFTSQMYVLAMLCREWSGSEELARLLSGVPAAVTEVLDTVPAVLDGFIAQYKDIKCGTVLGRGMTYPVALEGALKILETNRVKMKGYPISDFHHGPMAQIYAGDTVFLLASDGPVMCDAVEILADLDRIGADTIIITDKPDFAAGRKNAIVLPSLGSDTAAPFTMAVTLQLIALKLTEVRGIDPDVSDVLNKVTVTM